ncbi:hypothetical protein AHAS_Ahas18G0221500 [Arachis hypogaea]
MMQLFKKSTPSPRPIHPLLQGQKLTERDEQQIRGWTVDASLDSQQTLASYEGRPHLFISREELCTLRPRAWLNNSVIHWMCCAFNDSGLKRFTYDFYCVCLGILEMVLVLKKMMNFPNGPNPVYVELGEHFGADTRHFDNVATSKKKWVSLFAV